MTMVCGMTDNQTTYEALLALLQREGAQFRVIAHEAEGHSAQVAQIRGTAPGQGAKAMLCRSREKRDAYVLAVLPGNQRVDFHKVAAAMHFKRATLADPDEAMAQTGCVIGAIPPFALNGRYPLVVDSGLLADNREIAFNAGCLDHSIVLDTQDYLRIAQPVVLPLTAQG